jgi:hypothetical protein
LIEAFYFSLKKGRIIEISILQIPHFFLLAATQSNQQEKAAV